MAITSHERVGKALEGFSCLGGHYLLSVDGTGYYSSKKVHCDSCCEKTHRGGTTTHSHSMLGAVLVHPTEGRGRHFLWVTDLPLSAANGMALMRAGRALAH